MSDTIIRLDLNNERPSFKISVACHNCGIETPQSEATWKHDWVNPHYVAQKDATLQTQLCPKCHGFSLRNWLNKNRRFRILNRTYAYVFGYFWLPCPICLERFGGHETGDATFFTSDGRGRTVCNKETCNQRTKEGRNGCPAEIPYNPF